METGLNDTDVRHRLLWAVAPVALALWTALLTAWNEGLRLETWALPGTCSMAAALVALSPPTAWSRIHTLRLVTWVLCWPPLFLRELGLVLSIALTPILMSAMALSDDSLEEGG